MESLLQFNYSLFPHDKLPQIESQSNISIKINTGNSSSEGEHWVVMRMTGATCFYFDSFSIPIINDDVKCFANKYKNVI